MLSVALRLGVFQEHPVSNLLRGNVEGMLVAEADPGRPDPCRELVRDLRNHTVEVDVVEPAVQSIGPAWIDSSCVFASR